MEVQVLPAYDYIEEVKVLFLEYTNMLIKGDPEFEKYLMVQKYDKELEDLEVKYGLPDGRLYVAYCDGMLAGCIGLKKIDDVNCEMKRLYVRPEFRGNHLAQILIDRILKEAKTIGYSFMLLDTLPFLQSAIYLYKKYGFYEIGCYNNCPMSTAVYMKLNL